MIPGPANILSCPFCGGKKEVMSLLSGNTYDGTVWSDTRRVYPMLPEVSPIQQCPHCKKYYFIEQAKQEYSDDPDSTMRSFGKLGTLTLEQLQEAKMQMESFSLSKMQRWILNHQCFMAFNDSFMRNPETAGRLPTEVEVQFQQRVIAELLEGIERSEDYELFHAELLRESGRFDAAKAVLSLHQHDDDQWVVNAMLRHIEANDKRPFSLLENGVPVE